MSDAVYLVPPLRDQLRNSVAGHKEPSVSHAPHVDKRSLERGEGRSLKQNISGPQIIPAPRNDVPRFVTECQKTVERVFKGARLNPEVRGLPSRAAESWG